MSLQNPGPTPPTIAQIDAAIAPLLAQADTRNGLLAKAQTALANNQAFLALQNPTNAQAVAQVQALTRQVQALIYLELEIFTNVSGT